MNKLKLPHLTPKAFRQATQALLHQLKPSVEKVGAPPGTLTYTGVETTPTIIDFHQYDKVALQVEKDIPATDLKKKIADNKVTWISVTGFEDIEKLSEISTGFNIDQLTMEDLLNVSQLPKIEEHDDYLFITLKLVDLQKEDHQVNFTHYGLIIKKDLLITFSEKPNTMLKGLEERLEKNFSKLRNSSLDYLSYRVVDSIVDHYYFTLEWLTNVLADLELELVEKPSKKHINTILTFKKQWLVLRKAFYPLREAFRRMTNLEEPYMGSAGKHYMADLNDHLQSIGETMEIIRATLDNLMDLYNSTVSNKMNEVMQVLTIVSTIFIPITFIAGIYGMNFENMPELGWENGYYYVLFLMLSIGLSMVVYMKRKRWL